MLQVSCFVFIDLFDSSHDIQFQQISLDRTAGIEVARGLRKTHHNVHQVRQTWLNFINRSLFQLDRAMLVMEC